MSSRSIPGVIEGRLSVSTSKVRKRWGRRVALDGATLTVPEGSAYVLVGPNGAGKTTLMRVLLDLVRADEGTATVSGRDSVRDGAAVRALCGWLPEREDAGYGWMRVQDLLSHHAAYRPAWNAGYADRLLDRLGVRDHTRFGKLSKGEARRVQLVMALAHCPPVLLLDEPTDGLDPLMREQALEVLTDHLATYQTTLLVSTHRVAEVEGLGDHLGVLREGRLEAQLDRETMRARLCRYTIGVPEGWSGAPALNGDVVRRSGGGREMAWTVWGTRQEVIGRLSGAGAEVRDVAPVTLEEAAVSLLALPGADRRAGGGRVQVVQETNGGRK